MQSCKEYLYIFAAEMFSPQYHGEGCQFGQSLDC